jgi:hypothetical protein
MLLDSNIVIYAAQLYRSTRVSQTNSGGPAVLRAIFPDCREVALIRDCGAVGNQVAAAAEDEPFRFHRCKHSDRLRTDISDSEH